MKSKTGLILSGVFILLSVCLILTQGLVGESFIALILGMPWTLLLAAFEFGGLEGGMVYVALIIPIILNAVILYYLGRWIDRVRS